MEKRSEEECIERASEIIEAMHNDNFHIVDIIMTLQEALVASIVGSISFSKMDRAREHLLVSTAKLFDEAVKDKREIERAH